MLDALKQIVVRYVSQIFLILTLAGVGYFAYNLWQDGKEKDRKFTELVGTKEKYEQLSKYTAKLESDYKAQKDLLEESKKKFAEINRKKDERIQILSDVTYLISSHPQKHGGPDYAFRTPKATKSFVVNEVRIAGPDSPPLGYVMVTGDGKNYSRNYEFEIRVDTLQTKDEETGKVKVYSKAFLVSKESGLAGKRRADFKDWKGSEYPIEIVGGTALIDPTTPNQEKRFLWWAPRLVGGFDVGVAGSGFKFKPDLGFSFMGYGYSRRDLDWRFLQVGINADTDLSGFGLSFVPVAYRPLPSILTNTYVGPGIGTDKNGVFFFLNTSLGF